MDAKKRNFEGEPMNAVRIKYLILSITDQTIEAQRIIY